MPHFTVYLITNNYERWDNVEASSREELQERLEDEDHDEVLGLSDKQDCTSAFFDIEKESRKRRKETTNE